MFHVLYLLICLLLTIAVSRQAHDAPSGLVLAIGAIGIWRYTWMMTILIRSALYLRVDFPRLRRISERLYDRSKHRAHAFFLITSYKIDPEVSLRAYRAIFAAASRSEGGATIVAVIVDPSDIRLIKAIFSAAHIDRTRVQLIFEHAHGTGKRDALAAGLRTIRRQAPTRHDMVFLVDGDTCVPVDVVGKCAPFFTDARIGALTTDERSEATGSIWFRHWFDLRFTQRQVMMSSLALGGRVLTLTGRLSAFRANLATDPSFIEMVEHDSIDHWRFGRLAFLTGDDKSTWFWLLKNGYKMTYLPDVAPISIETQPRDTFFDSAITLMRRWFGNTMRTNGRALKLPPWRIGWFTWFSILDQRISMWTTVAGPTGMLIAALLINPLFLSFYIAWIMATRYVYCLLLSFYRRGPFPVTYPLLLYFGQIVGASVKIYVLFRLDRQKWTRQQSAGASKAGAKSIWAGETLSMFLNALAVGWMVMGVFWLVKFV
ncbi:glycosyltransferase [Martelella alba]|nr:glycosyltransferase [Martelella alba]